ncbi:MAG: nickel-dependent lactate racemase [Anaerolineales bacterium]|jgi:nickel-dependent lactate racemase|nr:nickel-dependent lactate racemase [Anaerolineales bacterium]
MMADWHFELPLERGSRQVKLPRAWLGQWVEPAPHSPQTDPLACLRQALEAPIGSARLEERIRTGQRVVIIVDDITRHTPAHLALPEVLERLQQAGIAAQDIQVVLALGTHRLMTMDEQIAKLGQQVVQDYPIVQSTTAGSAEMVYLGETANGIPAWVQRAVVEADFRIGIGMISPHMDAGFSGGAKIILPGVCGVKTVDIFHARAADHLLNPLGCEVAPLRLALEQFVREKALLQFMINFILTPEEGVFQCVAGDPVLAQRQGAAYARQVYGVQAAGDWPVVIANCAPYQQDLWQSCKGLWCGDLLAANGGSLIWVTQAGEGTGGVAQLVDYIGTEQGELESRLACAEADLAVLATGVMIGRKKSRLRISLVSEGLSRETARRMGLDWYATPEQAVFAAVNRLPESQHKGCLAVIPRAGITLPVQ